ncbi:MAG: hypothetical protein WAW86_05175 [Gammaproteobacteria bacterium]
MSKQQDNLINDILNLKNDALVIKKLEDNIFDFKSHIESKGWLGKVGISFSGRAIIDSDKKVVTYWDMIKKTSSGMGGERMGFSSETFLVKGSERSGSGTGSVPGGEKYSYDYGKVRELVRSVVEKNGWQFKTTLIKPKWWKGLFG